MKTSVAVLVFVCCASAAFAQQQAAPSVKMECRNLSTSGNVVFPNESLVNGMACHVVDAKQSPTPQAALVVKPTSPQATPSAEQAQSASPVSSVPTSAAEVLPNSVFISPMNGFENYLTAAFEKKKVPLTVVADQARAAYVITGTSEEKKPGVAKMLIFGQIHADNAASVQMIDQKTGAVVFAYAVNKKNTLHGDQTTAEACAKHLKEKLEKK